jgi:hypothetical protein
MSKGTRDTRNTRDTRDINALARDVNALIERLADGQRDDAARDALIEAVCECQAVRVPAYAKFAGAEARRPAGRLPALPTDVFRFARVAAHDPSEDVRVFRTSGTTSGQRGAHPLRDLSTYDHAARVAARYALFPDRERMRLIVLAPSEIELADSSLSYMLARFQEWFGAEGSLYVWREQRLDLLALSDALERAHDERVPVALLGTSFAFVHAEDGLGTRRFQLPEGSRIMQTGGFKGRSRNVEPSEMLSLLAARYGIAEPFIVEEYGMTELSSQLYGTTLRQAVLGQAIDARRLWVPGWVRAEPVDPSTLVVVPRGERGVLRIDDLANVHGVTAIQTADLAQAQDDGIVVLGRAPDAVARGCSIAVDEWLG